MSVGRTTGRGFLSGLLGRLRFPHLFLILGGLLLLDLLVPDPIPLVDESVLAILTLILGMWQDRSAPREGEKPPMKDVTPAAQKRE